MYGQSNAILDPKTGETLMYSELLKGNRVTMPPGYSMHPQSGKLHVDNGEDVNLVELLQNISSGGGGSVVENLVTTPIVDSTLNLTTDKYQTTAMEDNTTIVLPTVNNYTEIHLFFSTDSELTLILPSIQWESRPIINKCKRCEFIFRFIDGEWVGNFNSYLNSSLPIMDGLICWLDARDLIDSADGTLWLDRSGNNNNAELKIHKPEGANPSIKNGYYKTNKNGYVILPSFYATSSKGVSIFIDSILENKPTTHYDRLFTLGFASGYDKHFTMSVGLTEFGQMRYFESVDKTKLINNDDIYPKKLMIASSTEFVKNYVDDIQSYYASSTTYNDIFTNNYLNRESSTTIYPSDSSFGLILIYNRTLTEEEMIHNYLYAQSIERG